jgi:hypothetical protein
VKIADQEELYRHLIVFGSTGSGKTRHVILPLLARILGEGASDAGARAGALVFDVKGDMEGHLLDAMAAAGRTDPVLKIGRNGNTIFDPLEGLESSRAISERIVEIVRSIHPSGHGTYDDYWIENVKRLLSVCSVLSRIVFCGESGGLRGIAEAMGQIRSLPNDDDEARKKTIGTWSQHLGGAASAGWIAKSEADSARAYLQGELQNLVRSTFSVILNYAQSYLDAILSNSLAPVLEGKGKETFSPDLVFDQGRVALVSLSRVHFGPEAEIFRSMIKSAFQSCALQRFSRVHFDGESVRPVNPTRPAYLVADEFPAILSPGHTDAGDAFFLDKCREVRVGCILSAQGVSALDARMGDRARTLHLLNNTCTKIFMASDCLGTIELFERSMPEGAPNEVDFTHHSAPSAFRLPNYEFSAADPWTPSRLSRGFRRRVFDASDLRTLKTGEAIIVRPGGHVERISLPAFSLCARA